MMILPPEPGYWLCKGRVGHCSGDQTLRIGLLKTQPKHLVIFPLFISLNSLSPLKESGIPQNLFPKSSNSSSTVCSFLTTFAGAPTATQYSGISFVPILPAPIVHPFPIYTPSKIIVPPPIQTSSSIRTMCPNSTNLIREETLVSWPAL